MKTKLLKTWENSEHWNVVDEVDNLIPVPPIPHLKIEERYKKTMKQLTMEMSHNMKQLSKASTSSEHVEP